MIISISFKKKIFFSALFLFFILGANNASAQTQVVFSCYVEAPPPGSPLEFGAGATNTINCTIPSGLIFTSWDLEYGLDDGGNVYINGNPVLSIPGNFGIDTGTAAIPLPLPSAGSTINLRLDTINAWVGPNPQDYAQSTGGHAQIRLWGTNLNLGSRWCEMENFSNTLGPWSGTWIRRGTTNVFDGTWRHPSYPNPVTSVLTINTVGNTVNISRTNNSDGADCSYIGSSPDGVNLSGTYVCTGFSQDSWTATIDAVCGPPPPTVFLSCLTGCSIAYNAAANLTWNSTDASSCLITNNFDSSTFTSLGGTQSTGNLTASRTYTLTCNGPGGMSTTSATVTVAPPPPVANIACNGTGGSCTIGYNASANISWTCLNSTSGTVVNNANSTTWSALSDTRAINNITSSRIYTLTCNGPGGTNQQSVAVNVNQPAAPSCTVSFSPASVILGQSSMMTWSSTNDSDGALAYTCNGNIGSGNTTASGSVSVNPTAGQNCTLTAVNIAGVSVNCSAAISVTIPTPTPTPPPTPTPTPTPLPPAPTVSINCNGFNSCVIVENSSAVITWQSINATSCSVSPLGDTSLSGSQSTGNLITTTAYTITCSSPGGTASETVTVNVVQPAPSQSSTPQPSATQGPPPPAPQANSDFLFEILDPFSGGTSTLDQLFNAIIAFLYYIAGPIVVIMIVAAGLLMLFGRGEPDKINRAKKILLYAVVGLVIILIGRGFITLLDSILRLGSS